MNVSLFVAVASFMLVSVTTVANDAQRETDVATRGAQVIPFDVKAILRMFTKSPDGGTQKVVARSAGDAKQVRPVRGRLRDI